MKYDPELCASITARVNAAFAGTSRPGHSLTNPTHCPECVEHEATMSANTLDSLALEHVGNSGWNPICYLGPEGFRYWFPALVRIGLEDDRGGYLSELFGFFLSPSIGWQGAFSLEQQRVILRVFDDLLAITESESGLGWYDSVGLRKNAEAWRANLDKHEG